MRAALITTLLITSSSVAAIAQEQTVLVRGKVRSGAAVVYGAYVEVLGTRWAVSAPDGTFLLRLPKGPWRIRTSRIGFRPDTTEINATDDAAVAIQLQAAPQSLAGISVDAAGAPPLSQSVALATIRQVPAMLEPDVFRAVVNLPGITQPNDLKGRIHLAGGRSDETGVTLDGHPLHDPFHLLGVLGAFNPAAVERADVNILHVPSGRLARLSGSVDLRTREAEEELQSEAVVSLLSSSLTVTGAWSPFSVLASGRMTYLDRLLKLLPVSTQLGDGEIPLVRFHDGLLRLGAAAGPWRSELIGFSTTDEIGVSRDQQGVIAPLTWGERLGGVSIERTSSRVTATLRASLNRSWTTLDSTPARSHFIRVRRDDFTPQLALVWQGRTARAQVGSAWRFRRNTNVWRTGRLAQRVFSPRTPESFAIDESHVEGRVSGSATADLSRFLSVEAGGDAVLSPSRAIGPKMLVAWRTATWTAEASVERRYQFTAELEEPIEGNVSPPVFLLRTPRQLDLAGVAWKRTVLRLPKQGTAEIRASMFVKQYQNQATLPDSLNVEAFPSFNRIRALAAGTSASMRATWASGGVIEGHYTYQRSRERMPGGWSPTSWDAPQDFSLFGSVPLGGRLSFSTAYRAHSGRAVTPILLRVFIPYPEVGTALNGRLIRGARNSVRVPPYHRVDVGVRRNWQHGTFTGAIFAQILNVLNYRNALDYEWEQLAPIAGDAARSTTVRGSLPILPTIGVEVRW